MVTIREIAWAAGFIEGEGSVGHYRGNTAIIQASQVNRWCLDRLVSTFGGKVYSPRPNGVGCQPIYRWNAWGSRAVSVMMTIYPLMSPLRQGQIASVIHAWHSRPALHGEFHRKVHVREIEALPALRRILQGEDILAVSEHTGIVVTTLYNWFAGRWRPYLREQLLQEGFSENLMREVCHRSFPNRPNPVHLSDASILAAMRRVSDGEPIGKVATSIGVNHAVVSQWMSGGNRRHLFEQLKAEKPQEQWLYARKHATPPFTDDLLLSAMRRVRAGESMYGVAKQLQVNRDTLSKCLNGFYRPHLLARLQQEEHCKEDTP